MNTRYFLQPGKVNKKGQGLVMLDLRWRGLRLKLSTGVLVIPKAFINDEKKLLSSAQDNYLALNWKLGQLALDITRDYLLLEGECKLASPTRDITVEMMRELVQKLLGTSAKATPTAPKKAGTSLRETHARWQNLNRLKFSAGHLRHFEPALHWLDIYAADLTLEELNEEWIQQYVNWLLENTKLRNGGMRGHINLFRTMLRFARLPYEWVENPFAEYTPGIDLTYAEVLQLHQFSYATDTLRQAADVYVFLTQVGLRHGDFLKLEKVVPVATKDHGQVLVIFDHQQEKTKKGVTIPLTPLAQSIWIKYEGRLPKWTNQVLNRYLKLIGKAAGLTRIVDVVTVRGNVYTKTPRPLWEVLSVHTARHTAASLLLEGSDDIRVSQATLGQKNIASTNIYARAKDLKQIGDHLGAWKKLDGGTSPPP